MKTIAGRIKIKVAVSPNNCWEWQGSLDPRGYGRMTVQKTNRLVHRLSYEAFVCPIPNGMCVLHHCDNPKCCNPDHLYIGTKKDNSDDKIARGRDRKARGEQHHNAKLTDSSVRQIRNAAGSERAIARIFGISPRNVGFIRHGQSWRHVS